MSIMDGLVGYGSSDDEDEVQAEKPTKIARLEQSSNAVIPATPNAHSTQQDVPERSRPQQNNSLSSSNEGVAQKNVAEVPEQVAIPSRQLLPNQDHSPAPGPTQGPSQKPISEDDVETPSSPPSSPYTAERQRLRELTMPTFPDFDIPSPPPPPEPNSEEAASLAATTKKFERFLELKKQGVHFNERLAKHPALGNPGFLSNLMNIAGVSLEESYASSLPEDCAVRTNWPESCFVEKLMWQNERREKKRLSERSKVDFVPSSSRND